MTTTSNKKSAAESTEKSSDGGDGDRIQMILPVPMVPMIKSDSTDWNSTVHDYGTALDGLNNDESDPNMASLFDGLHSPTSIYTTDSLMVEEEGGEDRLKIVGTAEENGDENNNNQTHNNNKKSTTPVLGPNVPVRQAICPLWTKLTEGFLHQGIRNTVVFLSTTAAKYPFTTIWTLTLLSLSVLGVGFFTNFTLVLDSDELFTPINSPPTLHHEWLVQESGFNDVRPLMMILHKHGNNVLDVDSVHHLFTAVNTIQTTFGYEHLCQQGSYVNFKGETDCRVLSATRFWNHNVTLFQQEILYNDTSEEFLIQVMSNATYRDGQTPVFREMILGNHEMTNRTFEYNATTNTAMYVARENYEKLESVQSYVTRIELPDMGDESDLLETLILDNLKQLQQQWQDDDTVDIELEFMSIYAYEIENQRALIQDMPLVLGIFAVLVIFTTLVFHKFRQKVQSRSMLGCASLLAIGCSLALSYGIIWLLGVPFSNIAQILPFMVMGVGLDDTFIITGEYFRTDPNEKDVVKRIEQTMEEVGLSITLTSLTTMLAFALGSLSTIPGVRWLCWYAFAAIGTDFLFQITYFVALLTLDERRVQAHQQNCCFWRPVPRDEDDDEHQGNSNDDNEDDDSSSSDSSISDDRQNDKDEDDSQASVIQTDSMILEDDEEDQRRPSRRGGRTQNRPKRRGGRRVYSKRPKDNAQVPEEHFSERFMIWYGKQLLRPFMKSSVLFLFACYSGFCLYRATLLTQEFNVEDYVPSDSYLRGTLDALDEYYSLTKPFEVYFRDVDQADPEIQQQMRDYIDELAALPQIGEEPPFCWVRDFPRLKEEFFDEQFAWASNLTFTQQLNLALAHPTIREIYGEDIVISEDGNITASRCLLFLRNLDLGVVTDQIDMLHGQRDVSKHQPINQDREEWAFFSFDRIFFYWELYSQAVEELLFTIVAGIAAVAAIAFILIPHWTAVCFVLPGICILYCNFLGTMQLMGLHINSLTYVIVVMAIGILVDFLVHILLRYYETTNTTREAKVQETLRTMGSSMFVGGVTTFLSVCPLVLSTTYIFMTVFWAFAGIVALGFTHGLILLPVVLSLIGPVATHQGPPPQKADNPVSTKEISKQKTGSSTSSPEMTPTSSTTSGEKEAGNKGVDNGVFRSSTDEDLQVLKPDVKSEESLVKGPFTYEERETHDKDSRKRKEPPADPLPSDEMSNGSPSPTKQKRLGLEPPTKAQTSTNSVAELAGIYCGVDLSKFNIYNTSLVRSCAKAECKSPTHVCRAPARSSTQTKGDPSPSRPRRSTPRDPSPGKPWKPTSKR